MVISDMNILPAGFLANLPSRFAWCPEAFPVQGKVVPQEPDELSIYFFLIGE